MDKKRTFTITLLGVLEILLGIVGILMSTLSFIVAKNRTPILIFSLAIAFIIALFFLISGVLVLKLKPLGRIINIVTILTILLIAVLPKDDMNLMQIVINIGIVILCLLVFFYFTRSKAKEQFKSKN